MSDLHAHSAMFVRKEMLPQTDPPALESGAIKWLRENLFSGWVNTVLTVLGLAAIFYILKLALPWFLHGVWNANSLGECREIIAATWGEQAHGACWAVIRERWNQFMFGFYPRELYWRPVLALLLLLVALAPVLFSEKSNKLWIAGGVTAALILWLAVSYGQFLPVGILVIAAAITGFLGMRGVRWPANLLWFSGVYAGLAFWLLWGGTVWLPVVALLGFVVGWVVFRLASNATGAIVGAAGGVIAAVLWWYIVAGPLVDMLAQMTGRTQPFWLRGVDSDEFGGFVLAFTIGIAGIAISLPMGIILALGRRSDMPLVKAICVGFIEFIRGVPLITLLFVASLLLNYFLPPGTNFDIILRVIIMVTLFSAAYIAEVIRGGLAALPRGQYEAADALGLDYWKAQRLIIMPQALKISIPGIVSSFIGLFKDTTLVVFVALLDPLKGITDAVRADINWKGIYWEPYIFVGAIFFIVCFSMSRYSMYLENKLKREHR
ncbi:amino acid ABC transporter permease [Defluviimonas sp. WL0050]|uniref:Amino acid ABC transporter permease n=1 Tax=Albidovulum litorale TaxID=2984134 RepID=A0ABT2ZLL5_9RHOB|nr:amino acid ABC transporter permease [Defluviimonas sp. WL0050]MCV2872007.1 amino acid ABC transporter permease [Defluviimonas sp. WL0050]